MAQQEQTIEAVAEARGINPAVLAFHVSHLHGWRPDEVGYAEAVDEAATCDRAECAAVIEDELSHVAHPETAAAAV